MEQLLCTAIQTALDLTHKSINRGVEVDKVEEMDKVFATHYAAIIAAINANPLQETVVPRTSDPLVRSVG
jgi:hypothetical protein